MPLRGWQPSLVAPFAIVDVSAALNTPAMSLYAPQGNAWSTPRQADETVPLVATELDSKNGTVDL